MCRTQQIHATQSFLFAGHFISRRFSFFVVQKYCAHSEVYPAQQ
jgi:hypothetical protein